MSYSGQALGQSGELDVGPEEGGQDCSHHHLPQADQVKWQAAGYGEEGEGQV